MLKKIIKTFILSILICLVVINQIFASNVGIQNNDMNENIVKDNTNYWTIYVAANSLRMLKVNNDIPVCSNGSYNKSVTIKFSTVLGMSVFRFIFNQQMDIIDTDGNKYKLKIRNINKNYVNGDRISNDKSNNDIGILTDIYVSKDKSGVKKPELMFGKIFSNGSDFLKIADMLNHNIDVIIDGIPFDNEKGYETFSVVIPSAGFKEVYDELMSYN